MAELHTKDIVNLTNTTKRLVQDEEYYRYIFKKTEKIVSVVFYILHNTTENEKTQMHIEDIQRAAQRVHDAIITSLETRMHVAEDAVRTAALALVALESKLRVAHVSGVVTSEVMQLFSSEIESVIRGMQRYMDQDGGFDFSMSEPSTTQFARQTARKTTRQTQAPAHTQQKDTNDAMDRRERIKTILEAKGNASIKDISEVITDCSEKTIQRELNAMIEDNVVQRHGERRWSTYTIA